MKRPRTSSPRKGFTIVELLVATAITAVMAALLITITVGVMGVWNRSRGALTNANQAKIALDQLASDLQGAFFRDDGRVWMAASIIESNNAAISETNAQLNSLRGWLVSGSQSVSIKPRSSGVGADERGFVLDEDRIDACRFGMAGTWLRFFTTKLDKNSSTVDISAPAAVSYQICRRNVGAATTETAYMLYRSVVRTTGANSTMTAGFDLDPAVGAYVTPLVQGDPGTVLRPALTSANPQVLAHNVIDFAVRFYVREGQNLRLVFPARPSALGVAPAVGAPTNSAPAAAPVPAVEMQHLARGGGSIDSSDAYRSRFPDVVDISIRVLTEEGAQLIQHLEAGVLQGNWWDIAEAHSRVYTRRVELPRRSS